jgi:hypothetical protein
MLDSQKIDILEKLDEEIYNHFKKALDGRDLDGTFTFHILPRLMTSWFQCQRDDEDDGPAFIRFRMFFGMLGRAFENDVDLMEEFFKSITKQAAEVFFVADISGSSTCSIVMTANDDENLETKIDNFKIGDWEDDIIDRDDDIYFDEAEEIRQTPVYFLPSYEELVASLKPTETLSTEAA